MAVSADEGIFKERKYPFIFTFLVLLLCVMILLLTNPTSTFDTTGFYPDVKPQLLSDSSTSPKEEELPRNVTEITAPEDQGLLPQKEEDFDDVNIDWELCKGVVAVDYIPCLDNMKAIKALRTRRHMEHRERHCPDSKPHCLLPLPKGYKVHVPWPKSRDMVRLILW